ncbi:4-hydroxy-tetrahydrodipicolinate synthase [Azorhizobium sp. AG788]|uniref:dihydrodipicolinate synthase family protein n=1 Tax=Azorhizobium sp. AG788 TaxID=2183897 RepID=UPI0010611BC5|nr:dihydrodipicolinate synthase family protein [Azorhizobium sp. AG788]TDT99843.1 4-hydroxy-tetrahydrodipicolinate synthase [Azorhizobium sp. AG788]
MTSPASPFHGLSAFPITPSDPQGRVDTAALEILLTRLVLAGVDSIGLLGSTGTYAYLSRTERRRAVEAASALVAKRIPIVVGIGALRTDEAVDLARDAAEAGADGLLLAPVSYTPLTEDEVFAHFAAVAGATDLPLCVYNNPGTTHFTFTPALVARLATLPNVVALKNPAAAPVDAPTLHANLRAAVPEAFAIGYSADWNVTEAILAGGQAWYSVCGGLLPEPTLKLMRAAQAHDMAQVGLWKARFEPLWALFRELTSLRVTYAAANILGLSTALPPRPILPLAPEHYPRIAAALEPLLQPT